MCVLLSLLVSLLAVAEYESLHKQYLTENQYRQHIEEKLRKVCLLKLILQPTNLPTEKVVCVVWSTFLVDHQGEA